MEKKELKKLPVDYSTLKDILNDNCIYIDKTQYAYELITQERRCFLSRPHRFGKSLFVSTLEEILRGNKELFKDLWIGSSDYHWKPVKVVKLDFSQLDYSTPELFLQDLIYDLVAAGSSYGCHIEVEHPSITHVANNLFAELAQEDQEIALLIDAYDNPLIHSLHDHQTAQAIHAIMQQFFTIIKAHDYEIKFVFITGVSALVKPGIFSGMNNVQTFTLDPQFASACGFTDQEIDTYLHEHIQKWADKTNTPYQLTRDNLRAWCGGYCFGDTASQIYNPFSVLRAIKSQELQNFGMGNGTPTYLIDILKQQPKAFDLEDMYSCEQTLETFDIDRLQLAPLLFQAGYLTIAEYKDDFCKLGYPNQEAKRSLQDIL